MSQFSLSRIINVNVIVTASIVNPLILCGVALLGYCQSKGGSNG